MLISSVLGLIASLVLSIEAITLAENPAAVLSCDLSSKISCGAVSESWQAHLFGWPNSFLGLIAEPVVITVALAALGGVRFRAGSCSPPRLARSASSSRGGSFRKASFVIGKLCPWCLLITVTTTLVFMSLTRVSILDGAFGQGSQARTEPSACHVDRCLDLCTDHRRTRRFGDFQIHLAANAWMTSSNRDNFSQLSVFASLMDSHIAIRSD